MNEQTEKPVSRKWTVPKEHKYRKLTHFIREMLDEEISVRTIKHLLEQGCGRVNGKIERFASRRLRTDDTVSIQYWPGSRRWKFRPDVYEDAIVYEDESVLVYNKPAGLLTGPTKGSREPSLFGLLSNWSERSFGFLAMVHRLDRDTSGAVILVKVPHCLGPLEDAFRGRTVKKAYEAIVDGVLAAEEGEVVSSLRKEVASDGRERWWGYPEGGRRAETRFEVLAALQEATHVRLFPRTGRTHQLRVHMCQLGHPILGDFLYGETFRCPYRPSHHLLHAARIRFAHPRTGEEIEVIAPPPDEFMEGLRSLGL